MSAKQMICGSQEDLGTCTANYENKCTRDNEATNTCRGNPYEQTTDSWLKDYGEWNERNWYWWKTTQSTDQHWHHTGGSIVRRLYEKPNGQLLRDDRKNLQGCRDSPTRGSYRLQEGSCEGYSWYWGHPIPEGYRGRYEGNSVLFEDSAGWSEKSSLELTSTHEEDRTWTIEVVQPDGLASNM